MNGDVVVKMFDWNNPTDSGNYVQEGPLSGCPFNWHDDISGRMMGAIMAFLKGVMDDSQLELLIMYIQHYIHAPVWLELNPFIGDYEEYDEIQMVAVPRLREASLKLETIDDVRSWMISAFDVGMDPL